MIDFRFHLVSIVSIFLALAVGIVLGAGPLQGSIGTQLSDQVSALRQDKDALRSQLDDAEKSVKAQEQYAAAVAPAALAGTLDGRSVALVVTPDTAGKFAQNVQLALTQAGARITTVLTLQDDYRDPGKEAVRTTAAEAAANALGIAPAEDTNALLGDILARVLFRTAGVAPKPPDNGQSALTILKDARLIDVTQSTPERAELGVLLIGPISGTSGSVTSQVTTLLALVATLSGQSSGLVVATGAPAVAVGQEETTDLVTTIRKNTQLARGVSTVDHADTVIGAGVVALTAARQWRGVPGNYGTSSGAQAPVPLPL